MRAVVVLCLLSVVSAIFSPLAGLMGLVNGLLRPIGSLLAPILQSKTSDLVPNNYVIKLVDTASPINLESILRLIGGTPAQVFNMDGFKGFSMKLDTATLNLLRSLNIVDYIEEDSLFETQKFVTQTSAPWGLARLSSKTKGATTYTYDDTGGAGTCAYVIDTGIYAAHSDFGGRATFAANLVDKSNTDGNGHGTHVAGIIGGNTYGIAKKTKIYGVKVLNASGSGTTSTIIAGVNWVANDIKSRSCPNGTVANLSLGGSTSSALNSATKALIDAGVFLAVAAGNSNVNASGFSPASEPSVCTVGATTAADEKASFSNWGKIIDIQAPGANIVSLGIGSTTATKSMSGTSMAAPHIAGLAAYFLGFNVKKTPVNMCNYIKTLSNKNLLTGIPAETVNQLAFNVIS